MRPKYAHQNVVTRCSLWETCPLRTRNCSPRRCARASVNRRASHRQPAAPDAAAGNPTTEPHRHIADPYPAPCVERRWPGNAPAIASVRRGRLALTVRRIALEFEGESRRPTSRLSHGNR